MTTPMLPQFIISLFEDELKRIMLNVIDRISVDCSIEKSSLINVVEKELNLPLNVITEYEEVIKIQKIKPKKLPDNDSRCIAIINKKGILTQCTCSRKSEQFCKRHLKKHVNGTIFDNDINTKPKSFKSCTNLF